MALQLCPITEVELIHIQAVVTTTTVERLDAPVPHLTRPNAAYKRLTRGTLAALRNALRLVVAPQHLRWVPPGRKRRLPAATRPSAEMDLSTMMSTVRRRCSTTINANQKAAAADGRIELKVVCPQHFRCVHLGHRSRRRVDPLPDLVDRHPQHFLTPNTPHVLPADHPASDTQVCPRPPEPLSLVGFGAVPQPLPKIGDRIAGGLATFLSWVDRGCPATLHANRGESTKSVEARRQWSSSESSRAISLSATFSSRPRRGFSRARHFVLEFFEPCGVSVSTPPYRLRQL